MRMVLVDARLGVQVWFERDDSEDRVNFLLDQAATVGFGQIRIFLMWPWIQPDSADQWDFGLWDRVFEAAAARGITVKATLTANSGPWWLGMPSVLHTHNLTLQEEWIPSIDAYVDACVRRYAHHPALGQWILWNEPNYPYDAKNPSITRPVGAGQKWRELLQAKYSGDIARLNRRWRTGYRSFVEIPFLEGIAHPAHDGWAWRNYASFIDDVELRSTLIEGEIRRLSDAVRALDPKTPLCINPNETLRNHAEYGYRLAQLARPVDILGASFHAPWVFSTFAQIDDHTSLVVAGLTLLANTPGDHSVEVTEVQTGNTFYAGVTGLGMSPAIASTTFLAPLMAGADSVTGWCFNTREHDFEAGEWGLLDDMDQIGPRALGVSAARDALKRLDGAIGTWKPKPNTAIVLTSEDSQAVQFAMSLNTKTTWGTYAPAAVQGAALIAVELARLGVGAALAPISALGGFGRPELIVAAHLVAWDRATVDSLLEYAAAGASVLIDGTTGEFSIDAELHRPWPGFLEELTGLRSRGLETANDGHDFAVAESGNVIGSVVGVRSLPVMGPEWTPDVTITYAADSTPILWARRWGAGRLLYCSAALAPTVLMSGAQRSVVDRILERATAQISRIARPLSPHTTCLCVEGDAGDAVAIFAPEVTRRAGRPFTVSLPSGQYMDLWSENLVSVPHSSVLQLTGDDGIAILVKVDSIQTDGCD